jgi:hypothetical protein
MVRIWSQSAAWESRRIAGLTGPAIVALVVLAVFLIVPLLLLGLLAVVAVALAHGARVLLTRMRSPNGMLDGRRNVRVIVRDQPR